MVADKIKDLDVAVLVLNAGILIAGDLTDLSEQEVQDVIRTINVQYFYLSKIMLGQLTKRFETTGLKSGLIFTNSIWSTLVGEANISYAASKNATSSLAKGLYYELKNRVDVLDY